MDSAIKNTPALALRGLVVYPKTLSTYRPVIPMKKTCRLLSGIYCQSNARRTGSLRTAERLTLPILEA